MEDKHNTTTDKLLWWFASADPNLLTDAPADKRKFHLIGISILCTWVFATIVWAFFFSTVTNNTAIIIFGGVLMGLIVLTIDRVLIAGLQGGSEHRKSGPILFRLALALCLGAFMAQPALLFIFRKDIAVQLSMDHELKKQRKVAEVQRSMSPQMLPLMAQHDSISKMQMAKDSQVVALRQSFLAEADGSGGTGKVGISTIAKAKKEEYDRATDDVNHWKVATSPLLTNINNQLDTLTSIQNERIALFDQQADNGFLAQIESLQNLLATNVALRWRYMLLVAIIILIELAPVLSKLLLKTNVYNQRLILQEGYQLNLDREIFEKKYSEAKKFADSVHKSNLEQIEQIISDASNIHQKDGSKTLDDFELHHHKPATMNDLMDYFRRRSMGKHT